MNSKKQETISIEQLPENLQPYCLFPKIVPLMTYRNPVKSISEEILNATCKRRFCFSKDCPFKDIVDLG
ncbi:MAG: hypothetical protein WC784_03175 [Candidatus Shapirobacteria bacterium]|jgi:hypothetical protein